MITSSVSAFLLNKQIYNTEDNNSILTRLKYIGFVCLLLSFQQTIAQGQFGGKVGVLDPVGTTYYNMTSQTCDGAGTGNLSSAAITAANTLYLGDKIYLGGNVLTFGFGSSGDKGELAWRYYTGTALAYGTYFTLPYSSNNTCNGGSGNKKYEYIPAVNATTLIQATATGSYKLDVDLRGNNNGSIYTVYTSGNSINYTVSALGNPTSCTASISGTTATLGWTRFTGGVDYNVMIVRYAKNATPTAPINNTAYALNATIGIGTVVYATGSGTSTTNTVAASTDYDYYFYSENWSYYSSGQKVTALASTAPSITSLSASPNNGSTINAYNGSTITVSGTNFSGVTTVSMSSGGNVSGFTVVNATTITFALPTGFSGTVTVTHPTNGSSGASSSSITNVGYITNAATDWNTGSTWLGGLVPTVNSAVTIAHNITLNATATNTSFNTIIINASSGITFGASGTLTVNNTLTNNGSVVMTNGGTLTIASSGTFANGTNTFTSGTGILAFSAGGAITGAVNIASGATLTVASGTLNNAGGTLSIDGKFQINQGGFANNGSWDYGTTGTLVYNNTSGTYGPIAVNHTYWPSTNGPVNVTVLGAGGIDLGVSRTVTGIFQTAANVALSSSAVLTLNGTCQINTSGSFSSAPIYGSNSTLIYNTGGTFPRAAEWNATSGAGYPNNITVSGNTNLTSSGTNIYAKAAGSLNVSNGSTFTFSGTTNNGTSVGIEFLGNIINDGTITLSTTNQRVKGANLTNGNSNATAIVNLSSIVGGDLELTGNYLDNATFNANARAVFFTGTGTQTISGTATAPFNIDYVVVTKPSGILQLGVDLLTGAPNGGNGLTLSTTSDILDLNGKTFTLGTVGQTCTISGAGFIRSSSAASIVINGTGNATGTLKFETANQIIGTLTINRTATGLVTLGTPLTVATNLAVVSTSTLNNGGNALTVSASGNNSVAGILAGAGALIKTGAGTLTLTAVSGNNTANTYTGVTTISAGGSGTINVTGLTNITSTAIASATQSVTFSTTTPTDGTYQLLPGVLTVATQSFSHNAGPTKGVAFSYTTTTITVGSASITTGTITPTTYCAGTNATVPFTTDANLSGTYTAQLSDAAGSFASPVAIGTNTASPILATIPSNTTGGSGYRIRVVNAGNSIIGSDNGSNLTVNPNLPASVSIAITSGAQTICSGSSVTFEATPTNGGSTPAYQWKINGTNVSAATASTFTSTTLSDSDIVTVQMTSNASPCLTGSPATSNEITMTVNPSFTSGAINTTGETICYNGTPSTTIDSITDASGGDGNITYQWQYSTDNTFTTGVNTVSSNTATYTPTQILTQTTYYRRQAKDGTCNTTFSTSANIWQLTVNPQNTAGAASSSPTLCINTALTNITHTTSGASGITNDGTSGANGLPAGVSASWTTDTITISGTPTASGTFNYSIPLTGGCGNVSATGTITVNPDTIAGSVSGGTAICSGSTSGLLTLTNYVGSVIRWEYSVSPFTSWTSIANTLNTYTSGALTQTTQFRAVIQSGSCSGEVYSTSTTVTITTTTYKLIDSVAQWDNGTPDGTKSAIINTTYTLTGNINACSLTVNSGATVVISSGDTVTLSGALTAVSGSFVTFNSNANLIQTTNVANSGTINIARESSLLYRLDYSLWSSPVTGTQNLQAFSPETLANRFYTYNTSTNYYNAISSPSTTLFDVAKGYLIRMPNNWTSYVSSSTPGTSWTGTFTGVPNNGDITVPVSTINKGFNAIGNPYPSPISAIAFVNANANNMTGTLYFYRKRNGTVTNTGSGSAYATYTLVGSTVSETGEGVANPLDPNHTVPNGVIQVGQGFIAHAIGETTNFVFANSMRIANNQNQFFRNNESVERNRLWLNLSNTAGLLSQTLVGYMTNATAGIDAAIDGEYINDSETALTSLIQGQEFAVQGRALPFQTNDIVPLGFKTEESGAYTIALPAVDGLFSGGGHPIYLKDNLTGTVHDFKTGGYTFSTNSGTFNSRFEIVYALPTGAGNPVFTPNNVVIYNQNNELIVNSGSFIMDSIKVFDIRGRLLQEKKAINASQTTIGSGLANEVLLVQITSTAGVVVTKKVVR